VYYLFTIANASELSGLVEHQMIRVHVESEDVRSMLLQDSVILEHPIELVQVLFAGEDCTHDLVWSEIDISLGLHCE
jgi:hypothetical protein